MTTGKGETPTQQVEEQRIAEARQRVRYAIALHGGPWGGCDDCHELEQQQRRAIGGTQEEWDTACEDWERHLALD